MNTRALILTVVVGSSSAWPCSGLTCEQTGGTVPAAGATIPQNAPAIGAYSAGFSEVTTDGRSSFSTNPVSFTVTGPDGGVLRGTPVQTALGSFAAIPLTEGAWSVSGGPCQTDAGFIVGPPQPQPTESAILTLVGSAFLDETTANSCGAGVGARQFTSLRINPLPEMAPWLAVTRWELEVDGVVIATSPYGRIPLRGSAGTPPFFPRAEVVDGFSVSCGSAGAGAVALPRTTGLHTAQVFGVIEGWPRFPSNTLEIDVQCEGPRGCGCSSGSALAPMALVLLGLWRSRRKR